MTEKVQFFSSDTQRFYQLFPTKTAPTLKISGVPMHRHTHVDPLTDTEFKIKALRPCGLVLDTCTGLGYTSIYAAREPKVSKVITVEKDENVLKIADLNSFSKELFGNPKIEIIQADVFEKIKKFPKNYFDSILHDPPTFIMATELYSLKFYSELYRILKPKSRLWHYCPEPGKLSGKKPLREKIKRNLEEIGFRKLVFDVQSFGIIAEK